MLGKKKEQHRKKKPEGPRQGFIHRTMERWETFRLHSGRRKGKDGKSHKGPIVPHTKMKQKQAIAIALSMAERKYGPYVPKTARGRKNAALRAAGLRRGETRNAIKRKVGLG